MKFILFTISTFYINYSYSNNATFEDITNTDSFLNAVIGLYVNSSGERFQVYYDQGYYLIESEHTHLEDFEYTLLDHYLYQLEYDDLIYTKIDSKKMITIETVYSELERLTISFTYNDLIDNFELEITSYTDNSVTYKNTLEKTKSIELSKNLSLTHEGHIQTAKNFVLDHLYSQNANNIELLKPLFENDLSSFFTQFMITSYQKDSQNNTHNLALTIQEVIEIDEFTNKFGSKYKDIEYAKVECDLILKKVEGNWSKTLSETNCMLEFY